MKNHLSLLRQCPLFTGISEQELPALLSCLHARERELTRGEMIFCAGDTAESVGVLLLGEIQIVWDDIFGNRTILTQLTQGDLFGEAFACAGAPELPVSVVTAADSVVLLLDYARVVSSCSSACEFHQRLIQNMLSLIARKNMFLQERLSCLSRRSTREKVLAYLMREAGRAGAPTFTIPYDRQALADFLCVERSALSAELSRMQKAGILSYQKNCFRLLRLDMT